LPSGSGGKNPIQLRLLQAIESGDPDELPEANLYLGFIKQYADALGLNVELANSFPTGDRRLSVRSAEFACWPSYDRFILF